MIMVTITQKDFYNCFYLLCLLFALLMTLWASLEYVKNEDIIEISYRKFNPNEEDGQYPAISLCFAKPYNESIFSNKVGYPNSSSYDDFVTGKQWNRTMMEIDYDHVTINIRDHLLDTCMLTTRAEKCHRINKIETIVFPSPLGVLKCFSFHQILGFDYEYNDKEKINLDEVMIAIYTSIFPNNTRPPSGQFFVMFHYPFQLIRSIYTTFYNWPGRENLLPTYYSMQFYIQAVEKLKRRTGWNHHCYDWKYFDSQTMEDVMSAVGCKPTYWNSRHNHPKCNNSDQMKKIKLHNQAKLFQNDQFQKVVPPCVEIKKIDIKFEEITSYENEVSKFFYDQCAKIAGGKENWFVIHLHFWSSIDFKEIKQIRAYSMMSVIGNASGYIGFAVGWSISELPRLIFWLYAKTKKPIIRWQSLMTQNSYVQNSKSSLNVIQNKARTKKIVVKIGQKTKQLNNIKHFRMK